MLEAFKGPFVNGSQITATEILFRLCLAAVFGGLVAFVYRRSRHEIDITPTFPPTLVLRAILIAMVTQVIGDNVARAFSLVGALSIVRFRTVVRDTEDTAFVIFAVVIGMAVGARDLSVAAVGLVVAGGVAFLARPRSSQLAARPAPFVVHLRLGIGYDIEALVGSALDSALIDRELIAVSTAKQGLVVDASFRGALRPGTSAEALVKSLNRIEGVQSVELMRQAPPEE
jgi:hypothetical protein